MTVALPKEAMASMALDQYAQFALSRYGKEVVTNRAVPDYRDGLKPVHRYILWAALQIGLRHTGAPKKSARLVGDVIGKFHPHGDQAAYGAAITLANTTPPIMHGEGNVGTPVDREAAMRYCFTHDTLISTERGLIPIGDIPKVLGLKPKTKLPIDLRVETRSGVEQAAYWLDSGVRDIYKVTTPIGHVKGTENEPLLVLDSELNFVWRTIQDAAVGDIVCYKRNPQVRWPKSGSVLNQPEPPTEAQLKVGYKVYALPKRMSTEFSQWLGLLISEGSIGKATLQFMNSDPDLVDLFVNLTEKLFKGIVVSVAWKNPEDDPKGWATKPYAQVTINSTHIRRFLESNGIHPVSAQQKEIPTCVMMGSKAETVAFLSALFEGDGSAHQAGVSYCSHSPKLLGQLQVVMLTKFGLPFRLAGNTLYLSSKAMHDLYQERVGFISERKSSHAVQSQYDNQKLSWLPDVVRTYYRDCIAAGVGESGGAIPKYELAMLSGLSGREMPLTLPSLGEWLATVGKFVSKHFPTLVSKLKTILTTDYFLVPIRAIEHLGKEPTYDLTVPGSHSYTANGMLVHNTEMKISKYAQMFLLDPDYLDVVPYVSNYDGEFKEPLYLPALIPNLLVIGNTLAPAYGVAAGNPEFTLKSVAKAAVNALRGKTMTVDSLMKTLVVKNSYGSDLTSTADMQPLFATGKGSLYFCPKIEVDYKAKKIYIKSYGAGFGNEAAVAKVLDKIAEMRLVSTITDNSSKKNKNAGNYGACFTITPVRGSGDEALTEIERDVRKMLTNSEKFNLGVTIRKENLDDTQFKFLNYVQYFKVWANFRIRLETLHINNQISKREAKLHIKEGMYIIVGSKVNLDKAIQIIRESDDPKAKLMSTFNLSEIQADAVLDIKLRSLAKMESASLKTEIATLKAEIKEWKSYLKIAGERAALDLIQRVKDYEKKPDAVVQSGLDPVN